MNNPHDTRLPDGTRIPSGTDWWPMIGLVIGTIVMVATTWAVFP